MKPPPFVVHPNGRFLARSDGSPFVYIGDTAWELFHRATLDDVDHYMRIRSSQGFTVVQAVALAELAGLRVPNAYGECPLIDDDPARPNAAYFRHVDMIIDRAEWNGLVVGFLPTWGDKWNRLHDLWGAKVIFNPSNAYKYGLWLGQRYSERQGLIWILGGDRPVSDDNQLAIMRALAAGLREGDGGRHLISFHPSGWSSSAEQLHGEPWLDFNMVQSGHRGHDATNYSLIEKDYQRAPIKPCMDAEPCYEDHPVMGSIYNDNPSDWFGGYEVRKRAYWSVFAGAHGHTYGCHPVWQWWDQTRERVNHVGTPWRDALQLPGANQMKHLRSLLESRPFFERIPDQSLLASRVGARGNHLQATRGLHGSYAFVYAPHGEPFQLNLHALTGTRLSKGWFNPRDGSFKREDPIDKVATAEFIPPEPGFDWILVLDDAAYKFPPPSE